MDDKIYGNMKKPYGYEKDFGQFTTYNYLELSNVCPEGFRFPNHNDMMSLVSNLTQEPVKWTSLSGSLGTIDKGNERNVVFYVQGNKLRSPQDLKYADHRGIVKYGKKRMNFMFSSFKFNPDIKGFPCICVNN